MWDKAKLHFVVVSSHQCDTYPSECRYHLTISRFEIIQTVSLGGGKDENVAFEITILIFFLFKTKMWILETYNGPFIMDKYLRKNTFMTEPGFLTDGPDRKRFGLWPRILDLVKFVIECKHRAKIVRKWLVHQLIAKVHALWIKYNIDSASSF